jgi:hypothetical protein
MPYHRDMTLNTRLYLAASDHGPVLAVASLSGIKTAGLGANEFLRLKLLCRCLQNWFPQRVRGQRRRRQVDTGGREDLWKPGT